MSAVTTTAIAALTAIAAVGTFLAYLYFVRRSDQNAAREEALALAETRGEIIVDLRTRLEALERQHGRATAECEERIRELETALEQTRAEAREQAYQTQRFYSTALEDLLKGLRRDLEDVPPDVERALVRIRKLLAGERPAA